MRCAITLLIVTLFCSQAFADKPVQRLLVIEESQQVEANAVAVAIFGPKARGTFSVLMLDDKDDGFYVCSWRLTDEQMAAFKTALDGISGKKPKILKKVDSNATADEFTNARVKLKKIKLKKPKPNTWDTERSDDKTG